MDDDRRPEALLAAVGLKKRFGARVVVDISRLEVAPGEIVVVLGPSGAGKSVLLRMLDLLEPPSEGKVFFEGREVQGLSGRERVAVSRRMALIFQDPMLFSGTVRRNVEYGLKVRRVRKAERAAEVARVLGVVKLAGLQDKSVTTLSGGEAQRVALARALAIEPEVLLLDEPFASLDTPTRRELQEEVRGMFRSLNVTALFVTHDQEEAARIADRIVVLDGGKIVQQGKPREIFYEPSSEFVGGFVGFENIFEGVVESCEAGISTISVGGRDITAVSDCEKAERVRIGIRPEDVTLAPAERAGGKESSRNFLEGTVSDVDVRGPLARVTVDCPFPVIALVTTRSFEEMRLEKGSRIGVRFKATAVVVW